VNVIRRTTETQANNIWIAPGGVLGRITLEAVERAAQLRKSGRDWRAEAEEAPGAPSLAGALLRDTVAVIAEVKRKSPSKGEINAGIEPVAQAHAYVAGGAAAISVLTEPAHFGGSSDDLAAVAQAVDVPVIKKDFNIDPVQLYEARALGASAALLIARAVDPVRLRDLAHVAQGIGLETIVEVRDEKELRWALEIGATIIGVNNRNLESLEIDETTALRLIPLMPQSVIAVGESGMRTQDDVARVARVGADAVLVGTSVSAADDPTYAVSLLASVSANRYVRPH
jgi:indole-3-glycerol phosphate synthase